MLVCVCMYIHTHTSYECVCAGECVHEPGWLRVRCSSSHLSSYITTSLALADARLNAASARTKHKQQDSGIKLS